MKLLRRSDPVRGRCNSSFILSATPRTCPDNNIPQRKLGTCSVERFIHNQNIRHYRKLLEQECDEERRKIIRKLLAEEEAREIPAKPQQSDESKDL
jgi:hypothetical protein